MHSITRLGRGSIQQQQAAPAKSMSPFWTCFVSTSSCSNSGRRVEWDLEGSKFSSSSHQICVPFLDLIWFHRSMQTYTNNVRAFFVQLKVYNPCDLLNSQKLQKPLNFLEAILQSHRSWSETIFLSISKVKLVYSFFICYVSPSFYSIVIMGMYKLQLKQNVHYYKVIINNCQDN